MADIDFDLAPAPTAPDLDENDALPGPVIPAQATTPTTPAPAAPARTVSHTAGGLPAIPLAVIAGNSTVGLLSAAVLTGGPVAAAVAATGVVVATVATQATKNRRSKPKPKAKPAASSGTGSRASAARSAGAGSRTGGTSGASGAGGGGRGRGKAAAGGGARRSAPAGAAGPRTAKPAAGGTGTKRGAAGGGAGKASGKTGSTGPGRTSSTSPKSGKGSKATGPGKSSGRAAEIKALRKAEKAAAPTRAAKRAKAATDRKALADTRNAAKAQRRAGATNPKTTPAGKTAPGTTPAPGTKPGQAGQPAAKKTTGRGRLLAKTSAAMRRGHRRGAHRARAAHARTTQSRVNRARMNRARAASNLRMRRRMATATLRYWSRRVAAAAIAAPIGVLGIITTPLGRYTGWMWLQYPGRRLHLRLARAARADHANAVADIRTAHEADLDQDTADTDETPEPIADQVPRAPRDHNTYVPSTGDDVSEVLGFLFNTHAGEMEEAARAYEPAGMMHVRQTIKGLPEGLQSIANVFQILAEKSDEVFAMDPDVGGEIEALYQVLLAAVEGAQQVVQTFESRHEHDIARIEDPRNSLEAEKGWDITTNEDFT